MHFAEEFVFVPSIRVFIKETDFITSAVSILVLEFVVFISIELTRVEGDPDLSSTLDLGLGFVVIFCIYWSSRLFVRVHAHIVPLWPVL
jgi:hypothetical protein